MKAQSAIEYLTTYGWMLVAVSVVSGVAYTQLGGQCVQSSSGFIAQDIRVENFGTLAGSNELGIELSNVRVEAIEVNNVTISNSTDSITYPISDGTIDPGSTGAVEVPGFVSSEECNSFDLEIVYSLGGELSGQEVSGSIRSNFELENVAPPAQPVDLSAGYTG